MPPSRSGIADYSKALADELASRVQLDVFSRAPEHFDPGACDIALYQIGNNGCHDFVYEAALRWPGVVVMHESNLHHLIADITIKRGDWDAYIAEVEYNAGPAALPLARRVRALEVGPDYDGVAMTRRILQTAKGIIVHSQFMIDEMRRAGYSGPMAIIPHGAWIPPSDRMTARERLGLDADTPLIGAFGFLKPYKRIAESLRAFRRLVRVQPEARMILVGEPHPEFPVHSLINTLALDAHVRVLGFTPIEEFVEMIGACDVVLNLRWPTVGESSGSLLRSFGLGKAVLVSDVGSFRELPDEICVKVPVGASEEDFLFEYLNLFVTRPELAREMGERAKDWVMNNCGWDRIAEKYGAFLLSVVDPAADGEEPASSRLPKPPAAAQTDPVTLDYIRSWARDAGSRGYIAQHETRLTRTLAITPPGGPADSILEMGAYLQITPALHAKLGYGSVRGCYFGQLGRTDHRQAVSKSGEVFSCDIDHFDAEKDVYPYADESFNTVLCGELIEHLFSDPMHLMSEINRILKPGGNLVLTTPNISSLRALSAVLQGFHPGFFTSYIKPAADGATDARHNREYTPREIGQLFTGSGFEVTLLDTAPFRDEPHPEQLWVTHLLSRYWLDAELRGDGIYAVGCKKGPIRERWPAWLYS